jgi:hypothetical protein
VRNGEAKKMTNIDLLYPAIFIFSLIMVGLALTVIEFNKHENNRDD